MSHSLCKHTLNNANLHTSFTVISIHCRIFFTDDMQQKTGDIMTLLCSGIWIKEMINKQKRAQHACTPVTAHAQTVTCSMPHFWALKRASDAQKCCTFSQNIAIWGTINEQPRLTYTSPVYWWQILLLFVFIHTHEKPRVHSARLAQVTCCRNPSLLVYKAR